MYTSNPALILSPSQEIGIRGESVDWKYGPPVKWLNTFSIVMRLRLSPRALSFGPSNPTRRTGTSRSS